MTIDGLNKAADWIEYSMVKCAPVSSRRSGETLLGLPVFLLTGDCLTLTGKTLAENLAGEFARLRYRGGPGDEHMYPAERHAWEARLAEGGWTCVGWPEEYGGRNYGAVEQLILFEEAWRVHAPFPLITLHSVAPSIMPAVMSIAVWIAPRPPARIKPPTTKARAAPQNRICGRAFGPSSPAALIVLMINTAESADVTR